MRDRGPPREKYPGGEKCSKLVETTQAKYRKTPSVNEKSTVKQAQCRIERAAAAFVGYQLSISKTYTDPAVLEVG